MQNTMEALEPYFTERKLQFKTNSLRCLRDGALYTGGIFATATALVSFSYAPYVGQARETHTALPAEAPTVGIIGDGFLTIAVLCGFAAAHLTTRLKKAERLAYPFKVARAATHQHG